MAKLSNFVIKDWNVKTITEHGITIFVFYSTDRNIRTEE